MNLFELFVTIGVDDQASDKLSELSSKLGNGLKTAAKIGTAAVGAAAAGITALTTAAVNNYSEYEQLVGGVETLFKGSADKVQKYAANAYKTAGMSANEYMSTVTSFSAALLRSVGGNTEKAAKLADTAITDMSDNANKMGVSLESLKNAYTGFSRGNFTMLDNLALGFSGTKEGMQELLNTAEELSGVKYDIGSYADIVEAIHIVQTEMGITGTTAKEAASTIQGSVDSMKAAWENLTVAIADENADVESSVAMFSESVSTVLDNVMPRVEVSLNGILQFVEAIIPQIVNRIPSLISNFLPKIVESAFKIIKSFVGAIKNNAKMLIDAAKTAMFSFVDGVVDALPDVIDAFFEIISGIVDVIPDVAQKLLKAMPKIIDAIVKGFAKGAQKVVKAFVGMFVNLPKEAEKTMDNLENIFSNFVSFSDLMDEAAQKQVDLSKSLSDNGKTLSDIDDDIAFVEDAITQILKMALSEQQGLRDEDLMSIRSYNQHLRKLEQEKMSIYRDQQLAELRSAQYSAETASVEELATLAGEAQAALNESNEAVNLIFDQQLVQAENYYKALNKTGTKEHADAIRSLEEQRKEELDINKNYYAETIKLINDKSAAAMSDSIASFSALEDAGEYWDDYFQKVQKASGIMQDILPWGDWAAGLVGEATVSDARDAYETFDVAIEMLPEFDQAVADYNAALSEIDYATANAFLASAAEIQENGGQLTADAYNTIAEMLSYFDEMPGEMGDATKESLLLMVDGMEDEIPQLKNATEMSVSQIKDVILEYFGKDQGKQIGSDFISGIVDGVNSATASSYIDVSSGYIDGSHASGLAYVPYDGYIAQLHRGERILTAEESKRYSERNVSMGDVVININGASYGDEESLAVAVADALQDMMNERMMAFA